MDKKGQPNGGSEGVMPESPYSIPDGADYFPSPHKHVAKYAFLTAGHRVIVLDSEARQGDRISLSVVI